MSTQRGQTVLNNKAMSGRKDYWLRIFFRNSLRAKGSIPTAATHTASLHVAEISSHRAASVTARRFEKEEEIEKKVEPDEEEEVEEGGREHGGRKEEEEGSEATGMRTIRGEDGASGSISVIPGRAAERAVIKTGEAAGGARMPAGEEAASYSRAPAITSKEKEERVCLSSAAMQSHAFMREDITESSLQPLCLTRSEKSTSCSAKGGGGGGNEGDTCEAIVKKGIAAQRDKRGIEEAAKREGTQETTERRRTGETIETRAVKGATGRRGRQEATERGETYQERTEKRNLEEVREKRESEETLQKDDSTKEGTEKRKAKESEKAFRVVKQEIVDAYAATTATPTPVSTTTPEVQARTVAATATAVMTAPVITAAPVEVVTMAGGHVVMATLPASPARSLQGEREAHKASTKRQSRSSLEGETVLVSSRVSSVNTSAARTPGSYWNGAAGSPTAKGTQAADVSAAYKPAARTSAAAAAAGGKPATKTLAAETSAIGAAAARILAAGTPSIAVTAAEIATACIPAAGTPVTTAGVVGVLAGSTPAAGSVVATSAAAGTPATASATAGTPSATPAAADTVQAHTATCATAAAAALGETDVWPGEFTNALVPLYYEVAEDEGTTEALLLSSRLHICKANVDFSTCSVAKRTTKEQQEVKEEEKTRKYAKEEADKDIGKIGADVDGDIAAASAAAAAEEQAEMLLQRVLSSCPVTPSLVTACGSAEAGSPSDIEIEEDIFDSISGALSSETGGEYTSYDDTEELSAATAMLAAPHRHTARCATFVGASDIDAVSIASCAAATRGQQETILLSKNSKRCWGSARCTYNRVSTLQQPASNDVKNNNSSNETPRIFCSSYMMSSSSSTSSSRSSSSSQKSCCTIETPRNNCTGKEKGEGTFIIRESYTRHDNNKQGKEVKAGKSLLDIAAETVLFGQGCGLQHQRIDENEVCLIGDPLLRERRPRAVDTSSRLRGAPILRSNRWKKSFCCRSDNCNSRGNNACIVARDTWDKTACVVATESSLRQNIESRNSTDAAQSGSSSVSYNSSSRQSIRCSGNGVYTTTNDVLNLKVDRCFIEESIRLHGNFCVNSC